MALTMSNSEFIQTQNVRNVVMMMDDIRMDMDEGRFGVICGGAGLGKSRTVKWYHANHGNTVYLESTAIWYSSDLEFLRDLCRELGFEDIPHRKGRCFRDIVDYLFEHPDTVIFIDEVDRLKNMHLELMRDITRMTLCPIVLIGERKLVPFMQRNERVWTRTFEPVMFKPMKQSDVIIYVKDAMGVQIGADIATILHNTRTKNTSEGNFRLVKRALQYCVQYAKAKNSEKVTADIAKSAITSAVRWARK